VTKGRMESRERKEVVGQVAHIFPLFTFLASLVTFAFSFLVSHLIPPLAFCHQAYERPLAGDLGSSDRMPRGFRRSIGSQQRQMPVP